MATTTLTNGTKIPERASRDWYSDLSTNWYLLDNHLGDTDSHLNNGLAPKATADASGNTITSTYATKTELSTLSTTVGTKANDVDVVHKADAETITGAKTFSDTVTSADVVPSATDTYSLGSASVQYNAVYGKSYFYNGTQWGLDKANTWTGNNTFTSTITTKTNVDRTVAPASDATYGTIICRDKNGSAMFRMQGTIKTDLSNVWDMMMVAPNNTYQTFFRYTIDATSLNKELRLKADSIIPDINNSYNLGTSTNKWKSLNGINPGALSLPSTSYTDIDTTDWSIAGSGITWTAPLDGWLYIRVAGGADAWISIRQVSINVKNPMSSYAGSSALNNVAATVPVVAGRLYYIWLNSTAIQACEFIPCLGNV